MPDILFQPNADNDDDLSNAIIADDVTLPLSSQSATALGLTLGTAYKLRVLGAPETLTVAVPATAPAQMSAPTVTATGSDSISVDRAAAPSDGGSAITSYDLRHSTDESTWTTVTGIFDPQAVSGLTASTLYYVQTRAVNAVGAGAWSASGSDTTDAATSAFTDDFTGFTTGDDLGVDTTNYAAGPGNFGSKFAVTAADTAGMETGSNGDRAFRYIGSSPTVQDTDHFAEIEVADIGEVGNSGLNFYVLVRAVDKDNWVGMRFYQNRMLGIYRRDAGSSLTNPSASLETPATDVNPISSGDVFRIEAVGDTVTIYRNMSSICSWTDSALDTGGAFETGKPGLMAGVISATYPSPFRISYFKCGDA